MQDWLTHSHIDLVMVGAAGLLGIAVIASTIYTAHRRKRNLAICGILALLLTLPTWIILRQLSTSADENRPAWGRWQRVLRIVGCALLLLGLGMILRTDFIQREFRQVQASILAQVFTDVFDGEGDAQGGLLHLSSDGKSATLPATTHGLALPIGMMMFAGLLGMCMRTGQPIMTGIMLFWSFLVAYLAEAAQTLIHAQNMLREYESQVVLWPCILAGILTACMAMTLVHYVCPDEIPASATNPDLPRKPTAEDNELLIPESNHLMHLGRI